MLRGRPRLIELAFNRDNLHFQAPLETFRCGVQGRGDTYHAIVPLIKVYDSSSQTGGYVRPGRKFTILVKPRFVSQTLNALGNTIYIASHKLHPRSFSRSVGLLLFL